MRVSTPTRVFVARLAGLPVFDPHGDQVGRVRDVVGPSAWGVSRPRVLGLVVEVPGRRRVFVPMTRVTSVDAGQVITTGLVNMRRFEQRPTETLVLAELLDRTVRVRDDEGEADVTVEDIGIEQLRTRDWPWPRLVRTGNNAPGAGAGAARRCSWTTRTSSASRARGQGAANLLAAFEELKPADLANVLHDLPSAGATRSPRRWTTSGSPTCSRSCPSTTRWRSSPRWRPGGPPTCWRRWTPTTPPTCSPSCPRPARRSCST